MLSNRDASAPQWWEAKLKADHTLLSVAAADPLAVKQFVNFPRFMAAFIVFNDLMGGDEPFPREGCHAIFDAWFRPFPGIRARLDAAIAAAPTQTQADVDTIREGWLRYVAALRGTSERALLSGAAAKRVGDDPPIQLVYRDVGLPGDGIGAIDIVRIGGDVHLYEIVSYDSRGTPIFGMSPVCTVGDLRCGKFYIWP